MRTTDEVPENDNIPCIPWAAVSNYFRQCSRGVAGAARIVAIESARQQGVKASRTISVKTKRSTNCRFTVVVGDVCCTTGVCSGVLKCEAGSAKKTNVQVWIWKESARSADQSPGNCPAHCCMDLD